MAFTLKNKAYHLSVYPKTYEGTKSVSFSSLLPLWLHYAKVRATETMEANNDLRDRNHEKS